VIVRVKICGLTLADNAATVAALGVDYLGLNFLPQSKRFLEPRRGPELAAAARGAGPVKLVGVFVNASLDHLMALHGAIGFDVVQLHGDESPDEVAEVAARLGAAIWKAVPVEASATAAWRQPWPAAAAILLDAPGAGRGGSGVTVDGELARQVRLLHPGHHLILAGGLRPENVAAAICSLRPWAVDTASGVESSPGVKDPARVRSFLHAARTAVDGDVLPEDHG
jgi:phosphoribosylanthranilate isomerase